MPNPQFLHEAIADIAYQAGNMGYYSGDSREDVQTFIAWGEEFEALHAGREWDGEYMEEIEAFALAKLDASGHVPAAHPQLLARLRHYAGLANTVTGTLEERAMKYAALLTMIERDINSHLSV